MLSILELCLRWCVTLACVVLMCRAQFCAMDEMGESLPVLPQLVSLVDSDEGDAVSSGGGGPCGVNSSMHAIFFDPEEECLAMLTQQEPKSSVPVVFTGELAGARDQFAEDSPTRQAGYSTRNISEEEEEVACFDLVSSSSDEGAIPAAQPRYKIKDMWW